MTAAPHLIFLVGDEGIVCFPHNMPGAPVPFFGTHADGQNAAAILALAARHPRVPVTLLADTLAQDLRRDTVPRLNPFDRSKLVRRRLQQAFPQARLTASLPVKSDRTQILLAGVHDGKPVFEWLERLASARKTSPPRIALLPVECAKMVVDLLPQAADGWTLLLSRQRNGGFRQIVTYKGEIIFTRLTPALAADAKPDTVAETVAHDIQASRGYLSRLGLNERMPLQAILLMPDACHAALRRADLPVDAPLLLSPYDAAVRLNLPFAPPAGDPYGDLLFAQWFGRRAKTKMPLMPPDLRQAQRTATVRKWGLRTAAAAMLFAVGTAAMDAGDLADTLMDREQESARLASVEKKIARERTEAEPTTEPLGRLRQALERRRLFSETGTMPWAALQALNGGLGDTARLVKLDWRNDSGKPQDETLAVTARLSAAPDLTDRESAVARYRELAQNLARALPDYAVNVAHYPFPALPQEALSNTVVAGKESAADPSAEFSIRRAAP